MIHDELESTHIHEELARMLEHPHVPVTVGSKIPYKERYALVLRMQDEKLAESTQVGTQMLITAHGIHVARHPGGYKGYLQSLVDAKAKEDRRSKINTHIALWATVFGGLSFLATIYTIADSRGTDDKLDATNARLDSANVRLTRLQGQFRKISDSIAIQQQPIIKPATANPTATKTNPVRTPAHKPIQ